MTIEQTKSYLHRLGITDHPEPTLATLRTLQNVHQCTVPFENFDVYLRRPLDLSVTGIHDKIVRRKRGGYCFELNTLYGALLQALDYEVRPVMGRVLIRTQPSFVPSRTHLLHLVKLDEAWYVTDVGLGGLASRTPLPLIADQVFTDGDGELRLRPLRTGEYRLDRNTPDGWQAQCRFETQPAFPSDIAQGNFYVEHSPTSHFRLHRFIGLFTPYGRIGLFDNQFSQRVGLTVTKREEVADGATWLATLRSQFGVKTELDDLDWDRLAQ